MKQQAVNLTVNVEDLITPISCAELVIDIIKYIAYQKELIPFTYDRLKISVSKQKEFLSVISSANGISRNSNVDRCLKITQETFNSFENIFQRIKCELSNSGVDEIVVLLGSTILCPQDVFRIKIPFLNFHHLAEYHPCRKGQESLHRAMFLSEQFHNIVSNNSCKSNLYVLFKMRMSSNRQEDLLIPRSEFNVPVRGHQAIISFSQKNKQTDCPCLGVEVHHDSYNSSIISSTADTSTAHSMSEAQDVQSTKTENDKDLAKWYQVKKPIKSFLDLRIQGIPFIDVLTNPELLSRKSNNVT